MVSSGIQVMGVTGSAGDFRPAVAVDLRKRIELDDHPVASQLGVDGEEQVVDADVGKVFVDLAGHTLVEEAEHRGQIDVADEPGVLMVTFVGRLAGFAMSLPVVSRFEPGRQHLVQLVQGENLRGD
jgi:hypothetical protein